MRAESFSKIRQVLNYSSSVDKVSDLLGVDASTVFEIYKEQAEDEIQRHMLKNTPRNKRESQKALSWLGRDPSKEKVQKTLGIDEESVHQVEEDVMRQQEQRMTAHRKAEFSPNKKKCAKALNTLGLDLSIQKAKNVLGVDEDTLRSAYHALLLAQEEKILLKRRQNTLYLHDKKHNRKAYHVVGYDPSLEKVLDMLGVGEGTHEEAQVGKIFAVGERGQQQDARGGWGTAMLVYSLSAAILVASLARNAS